MKNNYCGKRVCGLEKTYVIALSAESMKNGLRMGDEKKKNNCSCLSSHPFHWILSEFLRILFVLRHLSCSKVRTWIVIFMLNSLIIFTTKFELKSNKLIQN